MTRPLAVIDGTDPAAVLDAIRAALTGDGPAVLPVMAGTVPRVLASDVPRRVALVIETSGSTGRPKRVALSTDALLASAAASATALGGSGQWLLALPVHYVAGTNVLIRSVTAQTDPILLPTGHFDPALFVAFAADMHDPLRFTSVVPAQLARLVDLAGESAAALATLRRFDRILVGGQATPAALIARAAELGLQVTRTYGSSETGGGCVYDGVPFGTTTVRLSEGEIEIAGPMLADGYLDDDGRTAANFVTDAGARWYRTGDGGTLGHGLLSVSGRLDDVIISGGVKISLDVVQAVVRALPGLADAVLVAADDERWGQVPVVVSVAEVNLTVVRAAVVAAIGREAAPARWVQVAAIPRLDSGKPDRLALRIIAAG